MAREMETQEAIPGIVLLSSPRQKLNTRMAGSQVDLGCYEDGCFHDCIDSCECVDSCDTAPGIIK